MPEPTAEDWRKFHLYRGGKTVKVVEGDHLSCFGHENEGMTTTYRAEIARQRTEAEVKDAKYGKRHRPAGINSVLVK